MSDTISIERLEALPAEVAPSTIYIVKAATAGHVDLYFTDRTGTETRRALNVSDIHSELMTTLATWIPALSTKTEELTSSFNVTLQGDVTGTGTFNGKDDIVIATTAAATPGPSDNGIYLTDVIDEGWFSGTANWRVVKRRNPDPAFPTHPEYFQFPPNTQCVITGSIAMAAYHSGLGEVRFENASVTGSVCTDATGNIIGWGLNVSSMLPFWVSGEWHWTFRIAQQDAFIPTQADLDNGLTATPSVAWLEMRSTKELPAGSDQHVYLDGRLELTNYEVGF